MFATVIVFFLLSATVNAQPAEVAADDTELLEETLQAMHDKNAATADIQRMEGLLSRLYNQDEERGPIACITICKLICLPIICKNCNCSK